MEDHWLVVAALDQQCGLRGGELTVRVGIDHHPQDLESWGGSWSGHSEVLGYHLLLVNLRVLELPGLEPSSPSRTSCQSSVSRCSG